MTKKEVQRRVLQCGKPLGSRLFTWDEKTRTFSSHESYLVIDFMGIGNCNFETGFDCTFETGPGCTFKTGSRCVVVRRRDVYEVIEFTGQKIKLNSWGIKGFVVLSE